MRQFSSLVISKKPNAEELSTLRNFIRHYKNLPIVKEIENDEIELQISSDIETDTRDIKDFYITDELYIKYPSLYFNKEYTFDISWEIKNLLYDNNSPLYKFLSDNPNITNVTIKINYKISNYETDYELCKYYDIIDVLNTNTTINKLFTILLLTRAMYTDIGKDNTFKIQPTYYSKIINFNKTGVTIDQLISEYIPKINTLRNIVKNNNRLNMFNICINNCFNKFLETDVFEFKLLEAWERVSAINE